MNNYIFVLENLSKVIEKIDKQLNGFAGNFDSPIYGTIIFLALLFIAMFFINGSSKK